MRSLAKYHSKRDFSVTSEPTSEPTGKAKAKRPTAHPGKRALSFCIQKHAASRLHFDFRLELDGVLLSWAVPKGPSKNAKTRRLAMQVEDHPLAYGDFEGVIPKGQYGGGTVLLWDRGTWTPEGDPHEGLEKGHLVFSLDGERLHGRWHLVRTGSDPNAWLLFKGKDVGAVERDDDAAERNDRSVASGRTMKQIADAKDRTWRSSREEPARDAEASPSARPRPKKNAKTKPTKATAKNATGQTLPEDVDDLVSLVERIPTKEKLTHLDKVLFVDQGLTKAALVAYYAIVADRVLPHLRGRPVTFVRCPDGAGKHCFFQKHPKQGGSSSLRPVELAERDGMATYMIADDRDGLFAAAQAGALELHVWGSREPHLEKPDRLVFDLDPDEAVGFARVVEAAFEMRSLLASLDLPSFVMTTGGKGLHVVVPVAARLGWDEAKDFTHGVANQLVAASPKQFTANMSKAQRKGRIFLDYLRNGRGATAVCPYSTRAKAGAPVATPVSWDELERGIDPASFTVRTIPGRLASTDADPWKGYAESKAVVRAAARRAVAA